MIWLGVREGISINMVRCDGEMNSWCRTIDISRFVQQLKEILTNRGDKPGKLHLHAKLWTGEINRKGCFRSKITCVDWVFWSGFTPHGAELPSFLRIFMPPFSFTVSVKLCEEKNRDQKDEPTQRGTAPDCLTPDRLLQGRQKRLILLHYLVCQYIGCRDGICFQRLMNTLHKPANLKTDGSSLSAHWSKAIPQSNNDQQWGNSES